MQRRARRFLVYFIVMLVTGSSLIWLSLYTDHVPLPLSYYMVDDIPDLSADAWTVFDLDSGEILYSKDADTILPIASVTKLATAAAILKTSDLSATTSIEWSDVNEEGAAGRLSVGEVYTYRDLLFPLLLESSNDAAHVFHRENPDLIQTMYGITGELKLVNTAFADTAGLRDTNRSTAREVAMLLRHVSIAYPHILDITSLPSYINHKNGWMNNNPLIEDETYLGGKHGFTYEANRTFAGLFEEEFLGGHVRRIGYVVLGSEDIVADISLLRDHTMTHTRLR